jgi:hypothetical protein
MGSLFVSFWFGIVSNLIKSFVLNARSMEKRVQNIRTDSLRVFVMSDDFAQCHSDLDCKFVSVPPGTSPKSLPEALGNPAFFRGGSHSGF